MKPQPHHDTDCPTNTLGILGGGQLGRMLALAAARLGLDVHIYCPDPDAPAARVAARHWPFAYDNTHRLTQFAQNCRTVTFEFENIPSRALKSIHHARAQIHPSVRSLEIASDRLAEKHLFATLGLRTANHVSVDSPDSAIAAFDQIGRGLLKTRHGGYDGHGQEMVTSVQQAKEACRTLGNRPLIHEEYIAFVGEISVILCRSADAQMVVYDPPRNTHRDGRLVASQVPSGFGSGIEEQAIQGARVLAEHLDHVGVLALEYFVCADGTLIANEMAPRVHNSGHWTEEICITGQFEQHVRAVMGLPPGAVDRHCAAQMDNIFGVDALTALQSADPGTRVRLYGKREPHAGRKMGHAVHVSDQIARERT